MKKLLTLLSFLPIAAIAQEGFVIKGNIKGLKDSTEVTLVGADGKMITKAISRKGAFTLKGQRDHADYSQLSFKGHKDPVELFIANDQVTVTGDALHLKSATVKGSVTQADFAYYNTSFNPLKEKLGAVVKKINAAPEGPKRDSLVAEFEMTRNETVKLVGDFIKNKPSSPVSAFVLFAVNPLFQNPLEVEADYNLLNEDAKQTMYAKLLKQMIDKSKIGMIGTQAIDFVQNDTANKPVALSSFKGKYVLLDFWASWCRPCRMENPNVVSAYEEYKNKNFTVLSVSLDQSRENWLRAIADDGLTWTQVSDLKYWNNEVARLYGIESIPQNFLLDPEGRIIAKNLRGGDLKLKLQELLK
ncbi:MAG: AhpC/TSA family protein [Bacteroidota bacterium]|nr:AhpC/TSA family protein [Bacteroidota bacterium]